MKRKSRIISALLCAVVLSGTMAGCGKKDAVGEETIKFLSCWNGDSVRAFDDGENNPIYKAIYEKTGIKIDVEYINVSEVEKLNQIFAAGTDADVISTAMWGMDDPCTGVLKKAIEEGMLTPLDDLVKEYGPNLEASFTKGLTEDFIEYDLVPEAAEGKHYLLPSNVVPIENRTYEYQDGLYVRKDILEATGVDVNSLKTSEDVYEFMKKIKDGGFKDANGRDVIVGGLTQKGGGVNVYAASYVNNKGKLTGMDITADGHVSDDLFSELLDKQTLFIRKLVAEGLLDVEGLAQTSSRANEKIANGMYALVPSNYDSLYSTCKDTLYQSHPEMEYVPIPPIADANGTTDTYVLNGTGGCQVLFIPASSDKAEAVIKLLSFLTSKEGTLLINYGIEGENWEYDDEGYVVRIGAAKEATANELYKMGIGSFYRLHALSDADFKVRAPEYSEKKQHALEVCDRKTVFLDGIRLSYIEAMHPKCTELRAIRSNTIQNDAKQMAYTAATDEEALGYLNKLRKQSLDAGIEEIWSFIEAEMAKNPDKNYID